MQNKKLVVISLFVLVITFLGLTYFYKNSQNSKEALIVSSNKVSLVKEHSMSFGDNKKNIEN